MRPPTAVRPPPAVSVAVAVLSGVAAAGLGAGLVAAAAAWPLEAAAGGLSLAMLAAAGALALRIARAGRVVRIPLGSPTEEVPEWPPPRLIPSRRGVLVGAGVAGAAAVAGAGLLAQAGPVRPPGTAWRAGAHVVTTTGRRLREQDVPTGGIATVWPEGAVGEPRSAVLLVRLTRAPSPPTVLAWVVGNGIVGYSKVCTHAGCAVGLFRTGSDTLYCPCHQAMFDGARGAVPTFGPASVAQPQLPLGLDDDGYLVALGDFTVPVGAPR